MHDIGDVVKDSIRHQESHHSQERNDSNGIAKATCIIVAIENTLVLDVSLVGDAAEHNHRKHLDIHRHTHYEKSLTRPTQYRS